MKLKALLGVLMALAVLGTSGCSAKVSPTATTLPPSAVPATPTSPAPPTRTPQPPTATTLPTATATATATTAPSSTATQTPVAYVVKQNDSLFNIAAQFHVDVGALTQANQLTTTVLAVGQKLIIPSSSFATSTPSPVPTGLAAGTKIQYTVLLGDTLEGIAAKFNSTAADISKANGDPTAPNNALRHLTNQNLRAQLVIVVPVNLVTPTATPANRVTPTATPVNLGTPTATPRG